MNESMKDDILNGEAANEFLQELLAKPILTKDSGVSYWLHEIVKELRKMNQSTKCNCNEQN